MSPGRLPGVGLAAAWFSSAAVALGGAAVAGVVFASWPRFAHFSHGWMLTLLAVWALWAQRGRFRRLPRSPHRGGLAAVVAAGALFPLIWTLARTFGERQAIVWLLGLVLVTAVAGLVLLEHGAARLVSLAFPLVFLLLAVPPPGTLVTSLVSQLKELSTAAAAFSLRAAGIEVVREGFVLQLESGRLLVSEACSGIRSLTTLAALGFVIAYFSGRGLLAGGLLALVAVPLSILANVARIVLTGITQERLSQAAAVGAVHEWLGVVVVVGGALGLYALATLLRPERPNDSAGGVISGAVAPRPPLSLERLVAAGCLGLALLVTLAGSVRARDVPQPALGDLPRNLREGAGIDAPMDGLWATLDHDVAVRRIHEEHERSFGVFVGYWGSRLWGGPHDPDACLPTQGFELVSGQRRWIRPAGGGPAVEASYRRYLDRGRPTSFLFWAQQGRTVLDPHPGPFEWRNVVRILARPPETRGRLFVLLSLRGEPVDSRAVWRLERLASELMRPLYELCPWARPRAS